MVVNSLLAALALLVCSNLASSNPSLSGIGHIARLPGGQGYKLFKQYSITFLVDDAVGMGSKKITDNDEWRNFSPTNTQCFRYLTNFINNGYKLKEFFDLILLDSCLGYLYDDHQYKWTDQTSAQEKKTLQSLIADENLERIYKGTKLETLSADGVQSFRELFDFGLSLTYGRMMGCGGWIRVATKYVQSRDLIGVPEEDTYIQLMSDVARRQGRRCFKVEAESFTEESQFVTYDTGLILSPKKLLPSPSRKQSLKNNWPQKMLRVLQKSLGVSSSTAIDFDQLQLFAYNLKQNEPDARTKFLSNLESFAKSKLKKSSSLSQEEANAAYRELIDDLCLLYINDSKETWIKILHHPEFFGNLEWVLFDNDDPMYAKRIRAMYLTTFMCRYIDQTFATTSNARYVVDFKDGAEQKLKIWPMRPPKRADMKS